MRELSPLELQERAADARSLLNSPVVKEVFDRLQAEYLQDLIQAPVGGLTAVHAHASMKALADVRAGLERVINDATFAARK